MKGKDKEKFGVRSCAGMTTNCNAQSGCILYQKTIALKAIIGVADQGRIYTR
jgi:hypothetical protein